MAWHRQGTVELTINQTTVIGAGTNFSGNARVGDAFQGPDGRWYEITNIAAVNVLSIFPPYQSASIVGGGYSIAPMQGYVKESADRLRAVVEQWGSTLSGLGQVASQNVVPIHMGGTGATNDVAARQALGLKTAAVVDVVGASAAGAIIETGTNANGRYTKFADGTLICMASIASLDINVPAGTTGTSVIYNFPAAFADNPAKSYSGYVTNSIGSALLLPIHDANAGYTGWRFTIGNPTGGPATRVASYTSIAIGRWK